MSKVENILNKINELNGGELELLLQQIIHKVDQEKRVKSILKKYRGSGKGIWNIDAQDYINQERNADRVL